MSETKYFDLFTSGLGYLNRIETITPEEGTPFLAVTVSALRGSAEQAQYTRFECRVVGKQAQAAVRALKPAVDREAKVLIGFTLSDLYAQAFTFKQGERAGDPGAALKARLLKIAWAKVDGETFAVETMDSAEAVDSVDSVEAVDAEDAA
jgi:hypothetical protein